LFLLAWWGPLSQVQARLSKTESQIKKLEAKTKDLSTGEEGEESNRNNMVGVGWGEGT
jgi:hypothetical protein